MGAKKSEELARNEDVLDYLNREITDSLVEVKGLDLSEKDTKLVGSLFHVVNDMERIGDHSQNIMESAQLKNQDEVKFSPKAVQELESLSNLVRAQVQRSLDMFKAQVTDARCWAKWRAWRTKSTRRPKPSAATTWIA